MGACLCYVSVNFYGLYSFCVSFGMLNALSPTENRNKVLCLSVLFNFMSPFLPNKASVALGKANNLVNSVSVDKKIFLFIEFYGVRRDRLFSGNILHKKNENMKQIEFLMNGGCIQRDTPFLHKTLA